MGYIHVDAALVIHNLPPGNVRNDTEITVQKHGIVEGRNLESLLWEPYSTQQVQQVLYRESTGLYRGFQRQVFSKPGALSQVIPTAYHGNELEECLVACESSRS